MKSKKDIISMAMPPLIIGGTAAVAVIGLSKIPPPEPGSTMEKIKPFIPWGLVVGGAAAIILDKKKDIISYVGAGLMGAGAVLVSQNMGMAGLPAGNEAYINGYLDGYNVSNGQGQRMGINGVRSVNASVINGLTTDNAVQNPSEQV